MTEISLPKYYKRHPKVRPLMDLLFKLGIKSARVGLVLTFAGMNIHLPGKYQNVVRNIVD